MRYGIPASRILAFALTSRCAIVASGVRNARAISGRRQAAEQAQRERHLDAGRQGGMAAGEDQPQPVVGHRPLLRRFVAHVHERRLGMSILARRFAPEPIDRAVLRRGDDPAHRARRRAARRPAPQRLGERVLHRFLGEVDVAEDADQHGDRAAVLRAEHAFDLAVRKRHARGQRPPSPWKGRTSIGRPSSRPGSVTAWAKRRAHASAASRSGTLTIRKPPTCSLPSA